MKLNRLQQIINSLHYTLVDQDFPLVPTSLAIHQCRYSHQYQEYLRMIQLDFEAFPICSAFTWCTRRSNLSSNSWNLISLAYVSVSQELWLAWSSWVSGHSGLSSITCEAFLLIKIKTEEAIWFTFRSPRPRWTTIALLTFCARKTFTSSETLHAWKQLKSMLFQISCKI